MMRSLIGPCCCLVVCGIAVAEDTKPVVFKARRIGTHRSEACAVGDFTGDGKRDIVAGPYLYVAPEWKAQRIREITSDIKEDGKGYADDFCNLPLDVNGDGTLDVISAGWFNKTSMWFENTGSTSGLWRGHVIDSGFNHETATLEDLCGTGRAEIYLPQIAPTVWYERACASNGVVWVKHVVDAEGMTFGAGVGDINGDGRPDIVRVSAWYEAPCDIRKEAWKKHPLALGGPSGTVAHASNIIVTDVNKDGLMDLIASSAHKYGIWWYAQRRDASGRVDWVQHTIDSTWSQAHFLLAADIDNDGVKEIVTGKRFMAHNGGDPDESGTLCIYYYDYQPGVKPVFHRHVISYDAGYGVGLNMVAEDLDGDGDLDLVTTGKWGGPVLFENQFK